MLVDHNALQGELGGLYKDRVVGCIDHHDEENEIKEECGEEPRVVEKGGSCCSLVVRECMAGWDALAAREKEEMNGREDGKDKKAATWDAELARLALGPILVDTTNLKSKTKTMPVDLDAAGYCEKLIEAASEGGKCNTESYFREISEAKQDIGGLTLRDILRKDYKQWTEGGSFNLGISSVVKNMAFLVDKAGGEKEFLDNLEEFAKERKLSMCSIMSTSHDDKVFRRELLVWAMDTTGRFALERFEDDASEELVLRRWGNGSLDMDSDEGVFRRCWEQEGVDKSRKQVAPLLRAAIKRML